MSKILVTGGAGYIGSHTVKKLQSEGNEVIIFDNLSTGHKAAALALDLTEENGGLFVGDLLNTDDLQELFKKHKFDAVIHFAAKSLVGESFHVPETYYDNNVTGTLNLLNAMKNANVRSLVFSSTAAVYGTPNTAHTVDGKIPETHPLLPINPYGKSKLAIEWMIDDFCHAHQFNSTALRYFNAAGNDASGEIGELHIPETHLIPIVIGATTGRKKPDNSDFTLTVFGDDYPTEDGTCIRDYIHVDDLAQAHILAVEKNIQLHSQNNSGNFNTYNVGTGSGNSVLEIIKSVENVLNKKVPYSIGERRLGDPSSLVAATDKIQKELGFKAEFTKLEQTIETVQAWTVNMGNKNWVW